MAKFKLISKFKPAGDQPKAIKEIIESLKNKNRYQTLQGVTGSGKTFIMASVIEKIGKPTLVIAPNKTLAAQLYSEYKNFFPKNKVCYFVSYYDYYQPEAYIPVTDTYIDKEAMINEEIDRLRHFATSALMTRKDVIIVASVSCIYNLGVPETYFGVTLKLHIDKPITRGDLIRQLVKIHFERTPGSLKRGTFRVRGDIFEIMPVSEEIIYRIELKDQKVSDIALVDYFIKNSKKFVPQNELIIFPPKHFISTEPERERALKEIKAELKERLLHLTKSGLLLEAERLERRTKYDLEMIKTIGYCHGVENYSRHLVGKLPGESPSTLLEYFGAPDGFLTIIGRKKEMLVTAGGKNVWPEAVELALNNDRLVAQSMVVGHGRAFVTALIVPYWPGVLEIAKTHGLSQDPHLLAQDPIIVEEFSQRVARACAELAEWECVKKFRLLVDEFSQERDELTPTLKLRRATIAAHYKNEIEKLYSSGG